MIPSAKVLILTQSRELYYGREAFHSLKLLTHIQSGLLVFSSTEPGYLGNFPKPYMGLLKTWLCCVSWSKVSNVLKMRLKLLDSLPWWWTEKSYFGMDFVLDFDRNQLPVDYSMQNMPVFHTDTCSLTDSVKAVVFKSHFVPSPCPLLPPPGYIWQFLASFLIVTIWKGCYWYLVDRDKGGCQRSYNAQDSPHNREWAHPKCELC